MRAVRTACTLRLVARQRAWCASAPAHSTAPGIHEPPAVMEKLAGLGAVRGARPTSVVLVSSLLGGVYLSFGGALFVHVAGGSAAAMAAAPGLHSLTAALVFPTGLSAITLTGVDLLTSNMMYVALPFFDRSSPRGKKEKAAVLARVLGLSFLGNLAGCVLMAVCAAAWVFLPGSPGAAFAAALATKKCALPFGTAVGKAIGANWLVCLAVFQAATATTTAGKIAAVWMPITTFVALGLEHSVANMFTIPLGMLCGADVSVADFLFSNLLPVCLGNFIGAGVLMSGLQWHASRGAVTGLARVLKK